jgi:hypothetical protein
MPLHTVQEIPKGQATPDNVWLNKKNTYISAKRSAKRDIVFMTYDWE